MHNTKILIKGRRHLNGHVKISGAKNAALPELAAVILSQKPFTFKNVPDVDDIQVMLEALKNLGADIHTGNEEIRVRIPEIVSHLVPKKIVETSRASILMLGPLVARNGFAEVSFPGGCPIGDRKINFHLEGLSKMGADIQVNEDNITASTDGLTGIEYRFPHKTVTGTENLLMAATLATGTTILKNCALEPEIGDLIDLLIKMGAQISGKNTETLEIFGSPSLSGAEHRVIPDRIEMGTYVIAGSFEGNEISMSHVIPEHIDSLLNILVKMGVSLKVSDNGIHVRGGSGIVPAEVVTEPYPGFPTDLQAQLTTLMTQAAGNSKIHETIFNNRFQHVHELNRLGAEISIDHDTAVISGITPLTGRDICSTDLRASAALVLGGLIADGETVVSNAHQLFRGYENMPRKLKELGADIAVLGGEDE